MMNSNLDDDFPPNPFRTDGGGAGFAQPQQPMQQQQFGGQQPFTIDAPPQQPQFGAQQQQQQQQAQFQPSAAASGMGGSMSPQMDPTTPSSTPSSWGSLCMACMRLDTYKRYFDVDTLDIQGRMIAAMTHFHQPQYFRDQVIGPENPNLGIEAAGGSDALKGPDLYGPVWITFVLILLVAATANWSASLHSTSDAEEIFEYDIYKLLHAWTVLVSFVFGVPTIFWLCTRCMGLQALTLAEWICYYGYSMVPYFPAFILCIIPVNFIAWVCLLAATGASGLLVLRNASTPLLASDPTAQKAPPLILAVLACHFIFFVVMGVTFYHHGKAHHAV